MAKKEFTTYSALLGKRVEVLIHLRNKEYVVIGKLVEFFEKNQALILVDYGIYEPTENGLKEYAIGDGKMIEVRAWVWIREI